MKTVYFSFCRMNPMTIGHKKLIDALREKANGSYSCIFLSKTVDSSRNPLTPQQKLNFAKRQFPEFNFILLQTLKDGLTALLNLGFTNGVFVVGEDRYDSFKEINKYSDLNINLQMISRNDDDASSTMARAFASENDFENFCKLMPTQNIKLNKEIYRAVKTGLKENNGLW